MLKRVYAVTAISLLACSLNAMDGVQQVSIAQHATVAELQNYFARGEELAKIFLRLLMGDMAGAVWKQQHEANIESIGLLKTDPTQGNPAYEKALELNRRYYQGIVAQLKTIELLVARPDEHYSLQDLAPEVVSIIVYRQQEGNKIAAPVGINIIILGAPTMCGEMMQKYYNTFLAQAQIQSKATDGTQVIAAEMASRLASSLVQKGNA